MKLAGLFASFDETSIGPRSKSTENSTVDISEPRRRKSYGGGLLSEYKVPTTEILQKALRKAKVSSGASLKSVLDAMFELDDLVPEKVQAKLYDFLQIEQNLHRMVLMLTSERSDVDAQDDVLSAREMNRYRYVVCIFILYGPPKGRETIAASSTLVRPILNFLTSERPLSVVGVEYVARVLASMLHTSPRDMCKHIASHPDFLPSVVKRIGSSAVAQLLWRMMCDRAFYDEDQLNFGQSNVVAVKLLADNNIHELLADRFAESAAMGIYVEETVNVLENSWTCMVEVSLRAVMAPRYSTIADADREPNVPPLLSLLPPLDLLQTTGPLQRVFTAAMDGPPYVLSIFLRGLTYMLSSLRSGKESKLPVVRRVVWSTSLDDLLSVIVVNVGRLSLRLEVTKPPLGSERLVVAKFFAECFATRNRPLCLELLRCRVHSKLLSLMFAMPDNAVLQPTVVNTLRSCLSSGIPETELAWLRELEVTRRIVETWSSKKSEDNNQSVLMGSILEMGRLVSDHMVENSKTDNPRDMNSIMGKANFDAFVRFRNNVLKQMIAERTDGICGRPTRPNSSLVDQDYVYDEDEVEALWIYNRLLDKEMGEDTEEGAIRGGKTKPR
eukprot:CAMPEP_0198336382 /NCGR_PEP_ID=MMETSP1450-20131203/20963_1 /TAXON_ID=753684 ORGANISM="Madagascaria erythrocladiodes, Strain CCMP3234" /NCGR_SAMPLE_ID=MMETSP1450 /ASSEMBLY_ACC=CAM_ASM_001115 /LENGTH=612 /DNA_ID=CAMNT_0044041119 /DNA_START=73 /DNA_END=1911 /DNA_ORIENTATION=+